MASPNFKFAKRQKELAKQAKNEEKRLRKLEKRNGTAEEETPEFDENGELIITEAVAADNIEDTNAEAVNPESSSEEIK